MNDITLKNDAIAIPAAPVEKVDFFYFTDPVCSHCWALDAVLDRVKHEFAEHLNVITVMGGMLENPMSDDEAKEMADHWAEVGLFYGIPIDGALWTEHPVSSTWPSSIAYLVLRDVDPTGAASFLRRVREAAFTERKDVGAREVLAPMLAAVGADADRILDVAYSAAGRDILLANMRPMVELGVEGFPTVVIVNGKGEGVKVVGSRTPETYRKALLKALAPGTKLVSRPAEDLSTLLDRIPTLFDNEAEKIFGVRRDGFAAFVEDALPAGSYELGEKLSHRFVRKHAH